LPSRRSGPARRAPCRHLRGLPRHQRRHQRQHAAALAGQPQQALSASLHAFKTGKRESTIMSQIAKGYTDEQIEQLAAWFAAQKKTEAAK
jgi:cytochrome c553